MIILNRRIAHVPEPIWTESPPEMGYKLNDMLYESIKRNRLIQKIVIEVQKPTTIHYVIMPGRWIEKLYDSGFLIRGRI